jgi:hypothetical protein
VAVRGTQSLVHQLEVCWGRPSLLAIELAWRWLFGIPALWLLYASAREIWTTAPLSGTGIYELSLRDPWQASLVLANALSVLSPPVQRVALWLAPLLGVSWALLSGLGRNLVLRRYDHELPFRPVSLIVLQLLRLVFLAGAFALWFVCLHWASARNIGIPGEPNLVGYLAWVICFSLGIFTLWALVSWTLTFAPLLVLVEGRGVVTSLLESFRLGKGLTGKLAEVNLVMGIIKLALIVLAMVFSATPLPFRAQMTGNELYYWWALVTVLYFVANDFFQVARAVSFLEFWRVYRGPWKVEANERASRSSVHGSSVHPRG